MRLIKTKAHRKMDHCDFCGGAEGLSEYAAPYSAKSGTHRAQWIDLCQPCAAALARHPDAFVTLEKGVFSYRGLVQDTRHEPRAS